MDSAPLKARQAAPIDLSASNSLSGFLLTLVPLVVLNGLLLVIFLFLRHKAKSIYQPLTRDQTERTEYSTALESSLGKRLLEKLSDRQLLNSQSLDAYFLLRFLKLTIMLAACGCVITWPILLPVNATGGGTTSQFDTLAMTNVKDANRLYAHALVAWVFYSFVCFRLYRELIHFVEIRQRHLIDSAPKRAVDASTILFTDTPLSWAHPATDVRRVLTGVIRVWPIHRIPELEALTKQRLKTAHALEDCMITLSCMASKWALQGGRLGIDDSRIVTWAEDQLLRPTRFSLLSSRKLKARELIYTLIKTLHEQNLMIEGLKVQHSKSETSRLRALFVQFESIAAAEIAFRTINYHTPRQLRACSVGVRIPDVLWRNVTLTLWQREAAFLLTSSIFGAILVFWAPIATLIGVLSNINYLATYEPFAWVAKVPTQAIGLLTGLIPTLALTLILVVMPIVLRGDATRDLLFRLTKLTINSALAQHSGAVTRGGVELMVQRWFFTFQVLQVFLLVTIGSSATAVFARVQRHPASAALILAMNLPKASNFYISYLVTYGISTSTSMLLNYSALLGTLVWKTFARDTPRNRQESANRVFSLEWGTLYPKFSMLTVIFLTYSILCPLILGFATVAMTLLYCAMKYNVFYVFDCKTLETRGLYFICALEQVMTGVYLGQLCLLGLFSLRSTHSTFALGPTILTAFLIVITAISHIWARRVYGPWTIYMPRDRLMTANTRSTAMGSHSVSSHEVLVPQPKVEGAATPGGPRTSSEVMLTDNDEKAELWLVEDDFGLLQAWAPKLKTVARVKTNGAMWDDRGKLRTVAE